MNSQVAYPEWSHLGRYGSRLETLDVAVLFGGSSSEREISLLSGKAALEALSRPGRMAPRSVFPIEWQADGRWLWQGEPHSPAALCERLPKGTVFLIALHGGEGEGGTVQGFLEMAGFAYTGAGVAASALCLDKLRSRQVFTASGLRVAPGCAFTPKETQRRPADLWEQVRALGPGPYFLKPSLGGSSVSMARVTSETEWGEALSRFTQWEKGEQLLVEQAIAGVEVTAGVMDPIADACGPVVLPIVEICPRSHGWFDHTEKYSQDGALEYCPPKNMSPAQVHSVTEAAATAWLAAGLTSYARIDMVVPETGAPVLLEANSLPGFTERSLFPLAARTADIPFRDLCLELILHASVS